MPERPDIVLINPGDRKQTYQELGNDYSAVEPPFWIAAIAAYLRNNQCKVAIIDPNAENITPEETTIRVKQLNPLLSAVIVYGSQPSASTQNMTIAGRICKAIKENTFSKVAIGGLHPSALPLQTIQKESVDFLIDGEGPRALVELINVLKAGKSDFTGVPGLWYRENGTIKNNPRAELIKDLDKIWSIAAWDLLPMDKYKAHNWHCFDDIENRKPYAAIYTSLGCPHRCIFCCINAPFGKPGIRYRSPELVVEEIGFLVKKYKVKNIKIVDELFVLDEKHYMKIVDLLIDRGYGLNLWAYARVDTVKSGNLKRMKKAGINWLALGIESANSKVRNGASKQMGIKDIKNAVKNIQGADIRVIGNFIFGLPDDTLETMRETLDMATELNCEFINFYCAMAYPGSRLYEIAKKKGWLLPGEWHGFSQHAYETLPLPTKHISAEKVLKFRDEAFHKYFENQAYLDMIEKKFG
ncbi:MAG: radical SAM protein, partial [Candidatus Omnitrophica bacterium]|nr:radical SAM protein [Candidatus Omnitrophota bacterium]